MKMDVIFVSHEKDLNTLNLAINGVKNNVMNYRRIIVVSERKMTDLAEWFDESLFPFSKLDIIEELKDVKIIGWIYQQLLKLYSLYVIPDISDNILIIDADTIFLNRVEFIDKDGYALYNVGSEYNSLYFQHASRLLIGFHKIFPIYSGICHHMVFQRKILDLLFHRIKMEHSLLPWKAICRCININHLGYPCLSEYEIYFNFVFGLSSNEIKVKIRMLKWDNVKYNTNYLDKYKDRDYISCHSWM